MTRTILTLIILTLVISTGAMASDGTFNLRRQADGQFDIAEKAYRKAIREHGETLEGFTDEEKLSACKKMSSALHDNRTQYNREDVFTQMKYKKQVSKLEEYARALGCPN